jgi:hypothetical protein
MKATLEFDLPVEEREYFDTINGTRWKILLSDFDRTLRNYLKHGHQFVDADDCLIKLREELNQDIAGEGLSLDW